MQAYGTVWNIQVYRKHPQKVGQHDFGFIGDLWSSGGASGGQAQYPVASRKH